VALDLPGHGLTEAAGDTPEALAEAVVAAMAALDLRSVHLVGLSLGGALAVMVAASAADRIKDLSLIAPVGFGTEVDQAFVDGVLGAATPAALAREIAKVSVTPVAISDELLSLAVARLNEPGRKRQLRALANHLGRDGVQQVHVAPRLDSIRCPIRIAWGYDDAIIPWRHALSAPGRVALHLYRGAGHIPFWDKPDAFADLIGRTP
jgi:pyruvate dehydrogenase E2 component (dihydrolipoamide acetyltransferase)